MRTEENMCHTLHTWTLVTASLQSAILFFNTEKHLLKTLKTKSYQKSVTMFVLRLPTAADFISVWRVTWRKCIFIFAEAASFLPFLCTLQTRVRQPTSTHIWSYAFSSMLTRQFTYSWNETPDTQYIFSRTQEHSSSLSHCASRIVPWGLHCDSINKSIVEELKNNASLHQNTATTCLVSLMLHFPFKILSFLLFFKAQAIFEMDAFTEVREE